MLRVLGWIVTVGGGVVTAYYGSRYFLGSGGQITNGQVTKALVQALAALGLGVMILLMTPKR